MNTHTMPLALAAPVLSDSIGNLPQTGSAWVTVLGLNFANNYHASHAHQTLYTSNGYVTEQPYASASRTNIIAVTRSASGWDVKPGGSVNSLINGVYDDYVMYAVGAVSSTTWLKFEFGMAAVVVGFKTYQQEASWGGSWYLQASNDNFVSSTTLWTGAPTAATNLAGKHNLPNLQSFRYYRFIGNSGFTANSYLHEVEFLILQHFCQTSSWSSASMITCQSASQSVYPEYLALTVGAQIGTGKELFTFDGKHLC